VAFSLRRFDALPRPEPRVPRPSKKHRRHARGGCPERGGAGDSPKPPTELTWSWLNSFSEYSEFWPTIFFSEYEPSSPSTGLTGFAGDFVFCVGLPIWLFDAKRCFSSRFVFALAALSCV
jgi:hypothetical protein